MRLFGSRLGQQAVSLSPMLRSRPLPPVPQPLMVYRSGKWGKLEGDALLPGDVVSVVRSGAGGGAQPLQLPPAFLLPGWPPCCRSALA
jgi:hypothetical protein